MRKLFKEYLQSLKAVEVEENLDLVLYRPLAFLVTKAVYPTSITPNQLTFVALVLGVSSGFALAQGTAEFLALGGILFALSNVFDCSDGMLARLKRNGTHLGRVIDGFADYIVGTAVYLGLGFGMSRELMPNWGWLLAILAGISAVAHSIYFDFYRNEFLAHALGKFHSTEEERNEFSERLESLKDEPGKGFERFAIRTYLVYLSLQTTQKKVIHFEAKDYYRKNRFLLRLWSWIGPTTHITALLLATSFQHPEFFFFYVIVFGNLWMFFLFLVQYLVKRSLKVVSHA